MVLSKIKSSLIVRVTRAKLADFISSYVCVSNFMESDLRITESSMRKRPESSICICGEVHGDICGVEIELLDPKCDGQAVVTTFFAHAVCDFGCV